ncbi:MAG: hypothetical protein R3202_13375, partial [Candidatus Competibacterales bacterium]|nr:hypothetical protein [Candidatus Competibacterales bacterium]
DFMMQRMLLVNASEELRGLITRVQSRHFPDWTVAEAPDLAGTLTRSELASREAQRATGLPVFGLERLTLEADQLLGRLQCQPVKHLPRTSEPPLLPRLPARLQAVS